MKRNLDVNALDEIPNKVGVYKFFNEMNQLIYIGNKQKRNVPIRTMPRPLNGIQKYMLKIQN